MRTDTDLRLITQADCLQHLIQAQFNLAGHRRRLAGNIVALEKFERVNLAMPDEIFVDDQNEAAPDFQTGTRVDERLERQVDIVNIFEGCAAFDFEDVPGTAIPPDSEYGPWRNRLGS